MISGRLAPFSTSSARLIGIGRRDLRRCRVDDLHQRFPAGFGIHHLAEQLGGQIEIDAARTARTRRRGSRAQRRCRCPARAARGYAALHSGLAIGELVHFLVVALLQVDDLALGRARDQDHREAVGGGVGERGQAVEEARRGDREADAGLLGQEAGDRGGIAGVLLVAEGQNADAGGLRHAAEVRDRDARHTIDGREAVELQRIDDEMEAVRQLLRVFSRHGCPVRLQPLDNSLVAS